MSERATDILYVITDLEIGGVPLHVYRVALAMRQRGWRVRVASLARAGPVGRMLEDAGIAVNACNGRGGLDARVVFRLAGLLKRCRPAIVHTLLFHANVAGRWAAKIAGLSADRVICEIQTVEVERRWHLWVDALTYGGCRLTIGNSPSVVDHLAAGACIPRDRLRLVAGGIDPAPIRAAAPADRVGLGLGAADRIVLWVGRLDPVKGVDVLIDAFVRATPQRRTRRRSGTTRRSTSSRTRPPNESDDVRGARATSPTCGPRVAAAPACGARPDDARVHLLIVGDGAERAALEARVGALGLRDTVQFLGRRDDVSSLLRAADVFAFPSRTEGLPNALLEAMAAGCAIVATDVPGCRDLIQHDATGLLVPYGDTCALADAIAVLLRDTGLAQRLGSAAAVAAGRDWHIADTFAAYETVYDEVIGGRSDRAVMR